MSVTILIVIVHVLSAIVMVAGIIGREITRVQMRATTDLKTFLALLELVGRFDVRLVRPFSMLIAGTGIALAVIQGYPMFGILQGGAVNWLLVANLLVISIIFLVVFVFIPRGKQFDAVLTKAKQKGEISQSVRDEDRDPVVVWAHRWENAATALVLILMIAKPF